MKWLKRGLWTVLALLVLAAGVVAYGVIRGLPKLDGEWTLPGLKAQVRVTRDVNDLTHIQADRPLDAWRALGFVHAQERGWQMEFNRRLMRGELSEVLGTPTLEVDKLIRTLGILPAARRQLAQLDAPTREALQAYSDGVTAAHASGAAGASPEFQILRVKAGGESGQPWTPEDSVAWALMMALDLGGNWGNEFARFALSRRLTNDQIWDLMPPYPGDFPLTDVDLPRFYRELGALKAPTAAAPTPVAEAREPSWSQAWVRDVGILEGKGSNNWVVPGSRTASGKPLLANDPHLALSAPAIWYFAHLQAGASDQRPALDVMGATLPGLPFVVLGRTRGVAWGFTNTGPDVQDLYLEAIDPARPGQYLTPQGWQAFEQRQEVIRVKGQPDVHLTVRSTRHGPVVSDVQPQYAEVMDTDRYVMALRWAALDGDNRTVMAGFASNQAQTVAELTDAYALHHSPMQSVVMADTQGEVGFHAIGKFPIRSELNPMRGVAPVPGWLPDYDWVGWVDYAENPQRDRAAIEARGWHATANQKIVDRQYPHLLTGDWHSPERMQRITQLLDARPTHDLASLQAIQQDVLSLGALSLLPQALKAQPTHVLGEQVMALLKNFDGRMTQASAAAAVFNVWSDEITRGLLMRPLGTKTFEALYGKRHFRSGVTFILEHPSEAWCPGADCTPLISQAMDRAIERMVQWQGAMPVKWRWGDLHPALSSHRPFAKVPVLNRFFNVSTPSAGDHFTINVGQYWANDPNLPFANRHAASLRSIYDLSGSDRNVFIYQTGQSGHPASFRSQDMALDWANGRYRQLSFESLRNTHVLALKPAP